MGFAKRTMFAVGAPVLAGGAVIASATPAFAAGPLETRTVSQDYIASNGQTVRCTLTIGLITHYKDDPQRGFASWDLTNTTACRNASVGNFVSWNTPTGGSGFSSTSFGPLAPAHFEEDYQPLDPDIADAQFQQGVSVFFEDCISNCSMDLSLVADGKA